MMSALGSCSDVTHPEPGPPGPGPGPEPEPEIVGLELPATVHLDAIRDSVRLPAMIVLDNGHRVPLAGGAWSGDGGDAATLHPDGWVWTRAEGEFEATVQFQSYTATTRVEVRRVGRIVLTFDDGSKTTRTVALPALAAAGVVANVAVVVNTEGWPGFLSRDDMQDLHDAGWAFVSHTLSHQDLTTLSAAELEAELRDSRQWILDQGLRMGDVFIVPYHVWGVREWFAVRRHYAAARGATATASWPAVVAEWRPEDPYAITTLDASHMLRTAAGRAEIMDWIRAAIDQGRLLDLMFHDVPPEDVPAFLAFVQDLAAVRNRVFTWADLYPAPPAAEG